MLGFQVDAANVDPTQLGLVTAFLLGKGIIKKNNWKGTVDDDSYLISWSVGAASRGTVWKIFGQQVAAKVFDGGISQYREIRNGHPVNDVINISDYIARETRILTEVAEHEDPILDSARILAPTSGGFVRELIDGITRGNEIYILPLEQIQETQESFQRFNAALVAAGYTDYDGDLTGNVVYHATRGWMLIDY